MPSCLIAIPATLEPELPRLARPTQTGVRMAWAAYPSMAGGPACSSQMLAAPGPNCCHLPRIGYQQRVRCQLLVVETAGDWSKKPVSSSSCFKRSEVMPGCFRSFVPPQPCTGLGRFFQAHEASRLCCEARIPLACSPFAPLATAWISQARLQPVPE